MKQFSRQLSCHLRRWSIYAPAEVLALVGALVLGVQVSAMEFMAGADISSLPVHEEHGAVYKANNVTGDAIEILSNSGVDYYRLRLFVNPQFENNYSGGGDPFVAQDLDYTIALAQRVKQAGGKVLLDFHYSDTWADPGHQWKPEAWRSLTTMAELEQQVYDYTKQSIEAFKAAGVLPEMVQIGNEIAAGLLWNGEYVAPQNVNEATVGGANSGYLWSGGTNDVGFDRLATLLSACIDGARDGAGPGEEPLIMIHHDQGSRWSTTSYYFDRLLPRLDANGTDPDVLGYSYYPLYHSGGIAGVEQNLTNSARTYGKPVVVVEAGFPFRNPTQSEQNLGFPVTEAGQQAYLQAVVDAVQNVPDGLGVGVFWWYAEAQPTSGLNVWQNGRYGLFDQAGNLLDAASVFEQFIDPILPGDYNGDGIVDAADFTVWRDRLGTSFTLPNENPDAATRGVVDQEDYDYWKSSFGGNSGAESIAAAVPEPTSIVLGMIAVAFTAAPIHRLRSADSANQHRRPR